MTKEIKDKIRGCFIGAAIGDAVGKPLESCSASFIYEKYGRVTDYLDCSSHKYFENDDKGTTTDDWQLTKAIAKAMITTGKIDLDEIAKEHVNEFKVSVRGWGGSTRESIQRISEGVHWSDSGKTELENRGTGNGVAMKVAPIGIFMGLTNPELDQSLWEEHIRNIIGLSGMTHRSAIAVASGISHSLAILKCFMSNPKEEFHKKLFIQTIMGAAIMGNCYFPSTLKDNIKDRFELLTKDYTDAEIIEKFGGGTCYVYDSLPFTYAFFLRNPYSIESLYDCLNSGGDTDTNCSMLGSMLGAYHGMSIFPDHLIEGLKCKDEVLEISDQFYEKFVAK